MKFEECPEIGKHMVDHTNMFNYQKHIQTRIIVGRFYNNCFSIEWIEDEGPREVCTRWKFGRQTVAFRRRWLML